MSADAGNDLCVAVRAALIADTFIAGKVDGRVFASWDNDAPAPFIRMFVGRSERFEMDGAGDGAETDFSVHVFTKEAAPIVCRQIAAKVRDVLQDADLALTGSYTFDFAFRDIMPSRDPDSPTLQILVVRFRVQTTSK